MLTIQIPIKPYLEDKLYLKKEHSFNEGITILVGRNGAGKSTLLHFLKDKCHTEKIPLFYYDNYSEGGAAAKSKYLLYEDMTALGTAFSSSEGQQIYMNFSYKMGSLRQFIQKYKDKKQIALAFDAIDSGLDLVNIADIKEFLENTVIPDVQKNGAEIYILISANSYGLVKNSRCYDVVKNKEITFNSYEEYERFILKQKKH